MFCILCFRFLTINKTQDLVWLRDYTRDSGRIARNYKPQRDLLAQLAEHTVHIMGRKRQWRLR